MDTTLSALFPAVPLLVGKELLSIRPIVLAELPAVERVMGGWRKLIASGGEQVDPEAWSEFMTLLAGACGRSTAWFGKLSEEDFEELVATVIAVNDEVLAPGDQEGSETITWARIFSKLVTAGHSFAAIQGMTLGQARALLSEAERESRDQLANEILASSFAMADGKAVKEATEGLRRG